MQGWIKNTKVVQDQKISHEYFENDFFCKVLKLQVERGLLLELHSPKQDHFAGSVWFFWLPQTLQGSQPLDRRKQLVSSIRFHNYLKKLHFITKLFISWWRKLTLIAFIKNVFFVVEKSESKLKAVEPL